jgi:hypothetical protein
MAMDKDIVPALLQAINDDFDKSSANSEILRNAFLDLKNKKANYLTAHDFSIEIGRILSDSLNSNISADTLPDGKMYYNIADRLLNSTLQKNYELIANYSADVQEQLNELAGFWLKGQKPDLNQDKIDGLVNKISNADDFDKVKWILNEPILTYSQGIVDDAIKKNADFHAKAGLQPKIVRKGVGKMCKWCRSLVGSYNYPNETPHDVFRRHENCRCTTEYDPKNGSRRRQDVWSKKWKNQQNSSKIQARKELAEQFNLTKNLSVGDRIAVKRLNATVTKPMTIEQADMNNTNPLYFGGKYDIYDKVKAASDESNLAFQELNRKRYVEGADEATIKHFSDIYDKKEKELQKLEDEYERIRADFKKYEINCQRCVPTYELRRRGIDVEALPYKQGKDDIWDNSTVVRYDSRSGMEIINAFIDPRTKKPVKPILTGGSTMKQSYSLLDGIVKDDERYFLALEWENGGGHIVNMEKINGILSIVDAQNGTILPINEYFADNEAKPSSLIYCRIDSLDINPDIVGKIAKNKGK